MSYLKNAATGVSSMPFLGENMAHNLLVHGVADPFLTEKFL
jgi:hypothetical protein